MLWLYLKATTARVCVLSACVRACVRVCVCVCVKDNKKQYYVSQERENSPSYLCDIGYEGVTMVLSDADMRQ